jgi:hypothetical protein
MTSATWDDVDELDALEELELGAEHDEPEPTTPTTRRTLGRTVRPRRGAKPVAARVAITGPHFYLYL